MAAVLAPYGTGHLEDPATLDLVTDATASAPPGYRPVTHVQRSRASWPLTSAAPPCSWELARFSWLGALALLVVWLFVHFARRRENLELWKVLASNSAGTGAPSTTAAWL